MNLVRGAVIVLVVAAVFIAVVVLGKANPTKTAASAPVELTGVTMDGQPFDLASTRGKPTVINFWASWCKYCRNEAPELVAFAKAHPEAAFVGVDVQDEPADAQAFVTEFGIPFPSVIDPDGAISQQFGITGYPTTIFLDSSGVEVDRIIGQGSTARFEAGLVKAQ